MAENTIQNDSEKIDMFLREVHQRKLIFNRVNEELADITTAVDELMDAIVTNFGQVNKAYEISHKYLVGSMAEGTSVQEPNEYDYLVIMKHLSTTGAATVERVCCADRTSHANITHPAEHARLKITDDTISKMYSEYVKDGYLCKMFFFRSIYPVEESLRRCKDTIVNKPTGTLSLCLPQVAWYGPANKIPMKWKPIALDGEPLDVSVDIILTIEIQGGLTSVVHIDDVSEPYYFEELKKDNTYLLVDEPGDVFSTCLRLTFTNTEVKCMKMLSEHHKLCYRLLKYILTDIEDSSREVFSSYIIKTFSLMHSSSCSNQENVYHCIIDILTKMTDSFSCFHEGKAYMDVKTIFIKSNYVSSRLFSEESCKFIKAILSSIVRQLDSIGYMPDYSYEACISLLMSNMRINKG